MEQSSVIRKNLEAGYYDAHLEKIYVDPEMVSGQRKRYTDAVRRYEETYGQGPIEIYSVPGRSEVGGNHTDHQHGMVLAAAVNLDALAVVGKNADFCIRVVSEGYSTVEIKLSDLSVRAEEKGTSAALIRGMAAGLAGLGFSVSEGLNVYVTSDVLIGAGLSSSAAFEVLMGTVISGIFYGMKVDPVEIAKQAQYAENVYFGKPCGLMDQTACSVGGLIHIDFEDPEKPAVSRVPVDFSRYHHSLCITDTKGSHSDLTEDYAKIPEEMKAAASCFGKQVLREVDENVFMSEIARVREQCGDRAVLRALHFFEENRRAQKEAEALSKGNFRGFLELVRESGNSSFKYLQNVYTCKNPGEQGVSVGLAVSEKILGNHGVCRVHGGGFAGTIQAFVEDDFVETYRQAMDHVFGSGSCHVLKVRPFGGMKVI